MRSTHFSAYSVPTAGVYCRLNAFVPPPRNRRNRAIVQVRRGLSNQLRGRQSLASCAYSGPVDTGVASLFGRDAGVGGASSRPPFDPLVPARAKPESAARRRRADTHERRDRMRPALVESNQGAGNGDGEAGKERGEQARAHGHASSRANGRRPPPAYSRSH
jgi:hypothetical protein